MFDVEEQIFCYRMKSATNGLIREGLSSRGTAITLMGLQQLEAISLITSPIDVNLDFRFENMC